MSAVTDDVAPALEFEGVHKGFGTQLRRVRAVEGLQLRVRSGCVTGLLGPDGAGKTTLMRLAAGLLLPDAGTVRVLGHDTRSTADAHRQDVGYMPQRFGLYDDLTVHENMALYADLQGLDTAQRRQRFDELLRLTALGPFGDRRASALSGGMKQKLGLACALLRAPRLLLLDEPTVGVDPISRRELWEIIAVLRGQGTSVLVSTAYLDEAERCDDIVLLHQGRLLAQQSPRQFSGALTGHCYRVRHAQQGRRQLLARLHDRPGVSDAVLDADGVRVVLDTAVSNVPSGPGEDWQAVAPRFEDAFVTLLQDRHEAEEVGQAVVEPGAAAVVADASAVVIEVHDLYRRFGSFVAVKGIGFEVHRGEVFGLLGANGAGKSTTFRMLCGLLAASSGTLRVAGTDLNAARAQARARIGYVAQKFALYGNLSVQQNLQFFAAAYGLRGPRRRERLDWALREFDLHAYQGTATGDLPLGYKQRLALACALLHEPAVLFLDEPTSGVDPLARREFWRRINTLAARGVTVLVTTHFMDEAEYCDCLVLMSQGEILAAGTPQQIRARARSGQLPDPTMEDAFVALIRDNEARLRRAA